MALARFHAAGADFNSLEFRQLLHRFISVCQSVASAHDRGLLHRDLKPANVMLGGFGETLVIGWGQTPGTPAFMSPEQAAGTEDVGPATDMFGLGATLYAILVGRPPYSGPDTETVLRYARAGVPAPPLTANPGVPKGLDAVCRKAMAREAAARYPTALALAQDVELWLAGEVPGVYRESLIERARRWARRRPLMVNGVAAVMFVAAIAAGVGAVLIAREQHSVVEQRDRADHGYSLADRTAGELLTAVIEQPGFRRAEFAHVRNELLHRALPLFEQLAAEEPRGEIGMFHRGMALHRVGLIHRELGNEAVAQERIGQACDVLAGLAAEHPDRPEYGVSAATCEKDLGELHFRLGRASDAETALIRARDRLVPLTANTQAADSGLRLAQTLAQLARVEHALGKRAEAMRHYREALTWRDAASVGTPRQVVSLATRAQVLMNFATLLREERNYVEGLAVLNEAKNLLDGLTAAHPDDPGFELLLAQIELTLANLIVDGGGDPATAAEPARAAVKRLEELTRRHPSVAEFRHEHAKAAEALGTIVRAGQSRE
jgi:eukaryotic-like serine/threonine-protein kinase